MHQYHLYIGADHRGWQKKEELIPILDDCHENVNVVDKSNPEYDPDDDFNDPALRVAEAVLADEYSFGILLCGSAHGVCMQANRVPGVRAINVLTPESAKIGREHDHANIVCLSADDENLDVEAIEKIVKAFCHARPNLDPRYTRRVKRLDEKCYCPECLGK